MKNYIGKKVVVIVDAGDRLGAAVARNLSYGGASVVMGCLESASRSVRELAHELRWNGATAIAVPAATSGMRQIVDLIAAAIEHFGRFDVIVNNHVWSPPACPESIDAPGKSAHRRDFHTWLYGAAAAMLYSESGSPGRLVNVILSPRAHVASEAGVEDVDAVSRRLFDRLDRELGDYRIRSTRIHLRGCEPDHWDRGRELDGDPGACPGASKAVDIVVRAIGFAVNQPTDLRIDEIRMSLT